ncbi:MAG: hypothetical protein F6K50_26635 [Moorea sp. SIO3I7]|uniref:Uncharacterized protein n=1 Tax=Moorena bouillonii PNG TaxID=568701 RepID=A0A1U7N2K2_9CYAN|nr:MULTISPECIES: HpsJ family protein [Moorena]NEN98951.1 hypothetical protein [Moorena sp. SIO3I7]NEO47180.1 hypothetical protein [Moorena sp. SIO4A3]NEO15431.1 hypothetical protein [Moorena sp. SIO3E8]NEQ02539.1 hypothetical protein [Moorena sp. SIO3F7]OLT60187.1 hypothetical protein BJP37_15310 [Moorena bouillonii PNG]
MTKLDGNKLTESVEDIRQFNFSVLRSATLLHWIGYGLLVLTVFDVVETLIPPNFMNPAWELQTIGALVERVPVPLLGLALVFYGERHGRERWEVLVVKVLSWLALVLGVLYFLLIPLGIINTVRINKQASTQITTQVNRGMTQFQQVKEALEKVNTEAEMEKLLASLSSEGRTPDINNSQELERVKEQLASFIARGEQRIQNQAQSSLSSRRLGLFKSAVKWNLGALVSGALFITIWKSTPWARRKG